MVPVLPYPMGQDGFLDGLGENVFICKLMYADFYNFGYTRRNVQRCLSYSDEPTSALTPKIQSIKDNMPFIPHSPLSLQIKNSQPETRVYPKWGRLVEGMSPSQKTTHKIVKIIIFPMVEKNMEFLLSEASFTFSIHRVQGIQIQ